MATLDKECDQDTKLDEKAKTTNYNGADLQVGVTNKGLAWLRSILRFDLTAIPDGQTIDTGTLRIQVIAVAATSGKDMSISMMDANDEAEWVETTATYEDRDTSEDWSCPNDFGCPVNPEVTRAMPTATGSFDVDIKTLVQEAYDNRSKILNIVMAQASEPITGTNFLFRRREHGTASQRPRCIVEYSAAAASLVIPRRDPVFIGRR